MLSNDMQMESKCEQPETIMEVEPKSRPLISAENLDQQDNMNKSNGLEVAIMLPPPPVLVSFVAAATASASGDSRPPSSLAATDKDEEEVLRLQVLSARSSTPYTVQGICCANADCGLEATTDSSNTSQWKEEPTQLVSESEVKEDVIDQIDVENGNHLNGHSDERKKYSRSDLLDIRDEMTIIMPECLESARLQRLHFRKSENFTTNANGGISRNKPYRNSNPPNDLMPAFYKRKAATTNGNNSSNSIVYDNFKYNDSNPFSHHNDSGSSSNSNYRRIGSGRITNREVNWDYIPEEDPNKSNLPEFFNTKDSIGSNQPKPQRPQKKHDLDDNANYVKRVIGSVTGESSFRSSGSRHSINSSGEERYNSNASSSTNNRSDEPEWFSCGPTSRLDTIELCGFNESDQQKIRLEMSKNKPDTNNNRPEFNAGHNNKEKKHLAFQFDDFSTSHNGRNGNNSGVNATSKMPSSKFMPLFNAKKRDEEANSTKHSSTQSLNEFFKRNDMPPATSGGQKEKLSTTEMPSVDEIEAKWRTHLPNDSRGKKSSENLNNSSESFKKILHQLNQQQQQHSAGAGSISSPPPQQLHSQANTSNNQQPPLNLFNNENLSNFIKHRSLQQQLLQKQQQQQAAFAQLQLNAILSRPDTQMLLLSLARGEISKHGLVIQLANPNLTQADREAISAVLTFSAAGQYHQQLAINSNQQQQQQFIANQLQNLALMHQINKSPVPRRNGNAGGGGGGAGSYQSNNATGVGNNPRTYTQEELQSHANFILHNAMLKKKLEEQNIGLQKMLHLQTTLMNGNMNNNARNGGNDSMAGTKNFNYQQQQHQNNQQQQQQQHHHNNNHHHQQHQRHRRGSNAGNRSNHPMGRRRSTSSSSSNTANSRNLVSQLQHTANMQFRRHLEQRRNTIATATIGGDDYSQVSQRI